MKTTLLKIWIQRFVVATSFTPFLHIYKTIYVIVIHAAVRFFKKYPSIKAVYLRRGCAKGDMVPGVSDIDLAVITEEMSEEERKELYHGYRKLVKTTTLLDESLEVYNAKTLSKVYETPHRRYRFVEGKSTWKLLYGRDYLADLPTASIEKMYASMYFEIQTWWTLFSWRLLQSRENQDDAIVRNSMCYKTVAEILRMSLALNHHTLTFLRSEALGLAKPYLTDQEKVFVSKLETIARQRFRETDPNILEETKNFLFTFLERFYGTFMTHTLSKSLKRITVRVDCSEKEWFQNRQERHSATRLLEYLKEKWSDSYRGAYLVSGMAFHLDEFMLVIDIDPERLPTVSDLTVLNLLNQETESPLKLFLLLPHAAFQIDPVWGKGFNYPILHASSNPEVFELLGRPEFTLEGGTHRSLIGPTWTPLLASFLQEMKRHYCEYLEGHDLYRFNSLDFLRVFWKVVQLVLINRSVEKDEIFYPLTSGAIKRGMVAQGISLPDRLQPLEDGYQDELNGKASDITALRSEAIDYLKQIQA